ncbi:MAG: restriction endonuclease subunit S, partial [Gammaproteobacteria bacterium]|nr:restriction endonuclease subunit S [Gammaproteobacteria bacterium]
MNTVKLGEENVAEVILGQSPPSSAYNGTGHGLPFFQGKADFGLLHPIPRVWCDAGQKFAQAGDVLMSVRAPVGDVNVATGDCVIGRGIAAIRAGTRSNPWFLYFTLAYSKSTLESRATGSTFASVNKATLVDLDIPLPEMPEQVAIGAVLRRITEKIEQENVLITTAQDIKRVSMRELFTRGLRGEPQKETEIGPVPESWDVVSLSEAAVLERGRFLHRPRNDPRFYCGKVPFIQTGDVVRAAGHIREYSQTLNEQGVAISRVFSAGTILITIAANIGFSGILEMDAACPDSLVAISPSDELNNRFLHYYLQTQQSRMDSEAPKGTQKNINIQFLSPWPVPIPTLNEQRDIVAILDAIDRKIDLHRKKRVTLEELFKTLLHKLMTGE